MKRVVKKVILCFMCFTLCFSTLAISAFAEVAKGSINQQESAKNITQDVQQQESSESKKDNQENKVLDDFDDVSKNSTRNDVVFKDVCDAINYIYIENKIVVAQDNQTIIISFKDVESKISDACLCLVRIDNEDEKIIHATAISKEFVSFEFSFSSEEIAAYYLNSIEYTCDDLRYKVTVEANDLLQAQNIVDVDD
ncbi:MAG: hypothetical protein MJ189_04045, partial [Coriobacteriales bacterium]|nr:hypothetical protein [Coriobacteriales bacterium]